MDLGGLLEGFLGPFWEALGGPLGGRWASWGSSWSSLGPLGRHWGSSWRSLASLGHHFGGPGALLGSILELSGAPWGHFGGNLCIFVFIWQFSCITAVFFKSILGKSGNQHRRVKRKRKGHRERGKMKVQRDGEKGRNTWT